MRIERLSSHDGELFVHQDKQREGENLSADVALLIGKCFLDGGTFFPCLDDILDFRNQ